MLNRLKVPTFICRCIQGNQYSSGLQLEVAYWPALAVGSAAQLAAAHCPNERTLDPQSAGRQTHLDVNAPAIATLWPSSRNVLRQRLTIFSLGTNCYSFTYPGGMESWVGLNTTSLNNLLKDPCYALLLLFFLFTVLFAPYLLTHLLTYCIFNIVFSYSAIQPQVCLINSDSDR